MMRTYPGDLIRVKMQAGRTRRSTTPRSRHEVAAGRLRARHLAELGLEELAGRGHLGAVHAHHAGAAGGGPAAAAQIDYLYSMDYANDGFWSGMWGIIRSHQNLAPNLVAAEDAGAGGVTAATQAGFVGVRPANAPGAPSTSARWRRTRCCRRTPTW